MRDSDEGGTAAHPFVELERDLLSPPADGILISYVAPASPFATAGLEPRHTIVSIDGTDGPDWGALLAALKPADDAPATRRLTVRDPAGALREVDVPLGNIAHLGGATLCGASVKQGQPGWSEVAEYEGDPDWSWLGKSGASLLRNSMGDARAGVEVLRCTRDGSLLHVNIDFRLGGDDGKGGVWEYRTRIQSTHRLDRTLSPISMRYREGAPGEEPLVREARLEDGRWRGSRRGRDGVSETVDHEPPTTKGAMGYCVTLLPATMPQEKGATLTFCTIGEGTSVVAQRERLVCVGQRETTVDGSPVMAWCYEWRHYGIHGESERFFVSDERQLVRVDWGPNYGNCWGEAVPESSLFDGVPEHVCA